MTIKEAVALTYAYYNPNQSLPDAVLQMHAEDLADLDPDAVLDAFKVYRRNPRNVRYPLPAVIRKLVQPEAHISPEDMAAEVAQRIVGSVIKFGMYQGQEAAKFIGPVGWRAVQRAGGWANLCESLGITINVGTFQAQMRMQLESAFRNGEGTMEDAIQNWNFVERGSELTKLGDLAKKLISGKESK